MSVVISQVVVSGYRMCQTVNGEGGYGGLCVGQSVTPTLTLKALSSH